MQQVILLEEVVQRQTEPTPGQPDQFQGLHVRLQELQHKADLQGLNVRQESLMLTVLLLPNQAVQVHGAEDPAPADAVPEVAALVEVVTQDQAEVQGNT